MKKVKLGMFGVMPILSTTTLLVSCSNPSKDDKIIDPDIKIEDNDFLNKPVNEKWANIDVDVETLQDGLTIKTLYEEAIINLNNQNTNLSSSKDDMHKYYKNLFYIAGYLRIISKANQNISGLKFESIHGHILQNDDQEANFDFALYVQHRTPITYNFDTETHLRNYFFKNIIKYQPGDLLTNDLSMPKNYLNLTKTKITHQEIMIYYRSYMLDSEKNNITKVFDYFRKEQDQVKYQKNIEANGEALRQRGEKPTWSPHPAVSTESVYFKGLGPWKVGDSGKNEPNFTKLSGKEWVKS